MNDPYKHPKWQKKRLQILERDGWKCVACDDSESTLHVHHFYYDGNPWDVMENFLQTLCEACHGALGEHPKGGLWMAKGYIAIDWCPKCKSQSFEDLTNFFRCTKCGWETSCFEKPYRFTEACNLFKPANAEPATTKQKSMSWLKGIISKHRRSGATDRQIWDAAFPDRDFPDAVFCVPVVGEWREGVAADAAVAEAAKQVGGLAADFIQQSRSTVWRDSLIEVQLPTGSHAAVNFLNRLEVKSALESKMRDMCGKDIRLHIIQKSYFGGDANGR